MPRTEATVSPVEPKTISPGTPAYCVLERADGTIESICSFISGIHPPMIERHHGAQIRIFERGAPDILGRYMYREKVS